MSDVQVAPVGRVPDFIAYHVRENSKGKAHWSKIGVAFWNKDSNGLNQYLDMIPLDGKVVLRKPLMQSAQKRLNLS